jgi:hypothetical protein
LVENYGFDDSLLKTMGLGKQAGSNLDADWGAIQILVYPAGTEIPDNNQKPTGRSSVGDTRLDHANSSVSQTK